MAFPSVPAIAWHGWGSGLSQKLSHEGAFVFEAKEPPSKIVNEYPEVKYRGTVFIRWPGKKMIQLSCFDDFGESEPTESELISSLPNS